MGTSPIKPARLVEVKTLEKHVKMLASGFYPRDYTSAGLAETADYIEKSMIESGLRVERQWYAVDGKNFCNIIAKHDGVGPMVVVGAHYDAGEKTPGADDNASGVAGILELARIVAKGKPENKIELVAYCLEEPPFFRTQHMGSYVHARRLADSGEMISGMVALEMIGYFSDAENSQKYPIPVLDWIYPSKGDFVAVVGDIQSTGFLRKIKRKMKMGSNVPVWSISSPGILPGIDFSDHLNYWEFGWPAVMVTDTAFYRNPNYHTPADTYATLDFNKMAKVIDAVYYAVTSK